MDRNSERHRDTHGRPLKIHAEWRVGLRTSAWDALWRRILDDLHGHGPKRSSPPLTEGEIDG
jgi:hypothetical protein